MYQRPSVRTVNVPKSTIDKWLHFDNSYKPKQIEIALGITPKELQYYMESPWKYFTILQMEKLAFLLDKDLVEVFWACYKRPIEQVTGDLKRLQLIKALERSGIK